MNDRTLLEVRNLSTWFGPEARPLRVVDGVSFRIGRGECLALLGESGCGKSMTALSLLRLVPEPAGRVVDGEVLLEGEDLLALPEMAMRRVRGRRLSMIFQEPMTSLNPVLTVGYQIGEVLARHHGLGRRARRRRAVELLAAVGIPDPARRVDDYPHQLSGGMKQRVMIALALAGEPDLLIADEPTTALDVTIQAQIMELLGRIRRERHMAMLLITHDLGVVADHADRVAVMYAGEIVEQAPRDAFFAEPLHPYARKLFAAVPGFRLRGRRLQTIPGGVPRLDQVFTGCRFADRCEEAWDHCRAHVPREVSPAPGRSVRCHRFDPGVTAPPAAEAAPPALATAGPAPAVAGPVLAARGLAVHFPVRKGVLRRVAARVRAVDGVDLELYPGRTLALVGESGCGKTTVGKALLQLVRPTAGSVVFQGRELTALRGEALRRLRAHMQMVFQDPFSSMNPRMEVGAIVEEGMRALGLGDAQRRAARVQTLLEQVGLPAEAAHRYPHEFSGGQRQRIAIARALAVEPALLVCDEPTSALDVSVQAQILNLLQDLQQKLGLSYLFITHNLSVVEHLAHEVAVMYLGRLVEQGPVEKVMQAPRHPYTRALLSAVPVPDPRRRREIIRLQGELPSPLSPPAGCHFHPRCPEAMEVCRRCYPQWSEVEPGWRVACHLQTSDVRSQSSDSSASDV